MDQYTVKELLNTTVTYVVDYSTPKPPPIPINPALNQHLSYIQREFYIHQIVEQSYYHYEANGHDYVQWTATLLVSRW